MKVYKSEKGDKIIFEVPYWSKRYNPYCIKEDGEPEDVGRYPTLTGLIIRHRKDGDWDEIGWALTLDMDYAGKPDQVGGFVVMWYGSEEDFIKKCEELGTSCHYLEN